MKHHNTIEKNVRRDAYDRRAYLFVVFNLQFYWVGV